MVYIPRTQLTSFFGGMLTFHFVGQVFQNMGHPNTYDMDVVNTIQE